MSEWGVSDKCKKISLIRERIQHAQNINCISLFCFQIDIDDWLWLCIVVSCLVELAIAIWNLNGSIYVFFVEKIWLFVHFTIVIVLFFKCKFVTKGSNKINWTRPTSVCAIINNNNNKPIIFNPHLHTHENLLLQHEHERQSGYRLQTN